MTAILNVLRMIWREEKRALSRGLLLSIVVLAAGAALLGLSGWFITAAGTAGVAGIGIAFDVFRPSAGVRMLALGRAAARYGERLLTHDATLRALARLRVRVLDGLSGQGADLIARLRSPSLLNRVIADVDALDGIAIRLVFPLLAGLATLLLAFVGVALLVTPAIALWITLCLLAGGAAAALWLGRPAVTHANAAEAARQALRAGSAEHLRARTALAFAGALEDNRADVLALDAEARSAETRLAGVERRAAALASAGAVVAAGGALLFGALMAEAQLLSPALAAIGVFVALALSEVLAPLPRALAEIGRMRLAAERLSPVLTRSGADPDTQDMRELRRPVELSLSEVSVGRPGGGPVLIEPVSLVVRPGETVALIGPSGLGKSTLLQAIAGLTPPVSGQIDCGGQPMTGTTEAELRTRVGFLPQRSQLISGTVRSNLALAAPEADDAEMLSVLHGLCLGPALAARAGLDTTLGEGGTGLSGGESRRLALARVLLRRPPVLLLDEPTEGLDAATAEAVLRAIRSYLPEAAILLTTHKSEDIARCDRWLSLKSIS